MAIISTKSEAIALLQRWTFGNTMQTWNSLSDLKASEFSGKIGIRYKGLTGQGFWLPDVSIENIAETFLHLVHRGAEIERILYTEMAPTEIATISGELMRSEKYLDLTYSTRRLPLREAIAAEPRYVSGIEAVIVLKTLTGEDVYSWFMTIFDDYPDSVIEFTVFERSVGILNTETVIWEVRNY